VHFDPLKQHILRRAGGLDVLARLALTKTEALFQAERQERASDEADVVWPARPEVPDRRSRSASSLCSELNENSSVTQGALHERARNGASSLRIPLIDHDDVDRDAKPSERAAKPHRLLDRILDKRLDHEHVDIGRAARFATSSRLNRTTETKRA
jgi:hypothetical protein